MNILLKSELLALKELMPELSQLDPQQLVANLYENGALEVHEAAAILDENSTTDARMFLLLKYSFSPYKDMACSPFMIFVFALMKYHPSLAFNLRQEQVKLQESLSSQQCNSQELFSTYQAIFFGDGDSQARVSTAKMSYSSEMAILSHTENVSSGVFLITTMDVSDDSTGALINEDDNLDTDQCVLYSIPSLIDELDNKKLAEALDTVEIKYQELLENKSWRSYHKFTRLLRPYCNTIPLLLETMYCSRIRKHIANHEPLDALQLGTTLLNSQMCMKKSDRLVTSALCLIVEIYNSMGWITTAEQYFIPALQIASNKTVSSTKIKLFCAIAKYFARGYYTTEQCFWLRPDYDIKGRAVGWFRTILSLLISFNLSGRETLHTSLLFAEFLIQSRVNNEGALRMEPRKVPVGDRLDASNLLNFVEARLKNFPVSPRHRALFLVTKFDYGICCNNYMLSMDVHQQGEDLGGGLFTDLLFSWFPFGEPPLPEVEDVQQVISAPRRLLRYAGLDIEDWGRAGVSNTVFHSTEPGIYGATQSTMFCWDTWLGTSRRQYTSSATMGCRWGILASASVQDPSHARCMTLTRVFNVSIIKAPFTHCWCVLRK